jgi:hypothetical protein
MTSMLRRKALSAIVMTFCAGSVLLALVPLGFVLFFVVSQASDRSTSLSSRTCRCRWASRAAGWRTRSSAR